MPAQDNSQFRASNTFRHKQGVMKQNPNETRNVFGTVGSNKMAAFNSTKSILSNQN